MLISQNTKVTRCINAAANGSGTTNGTAIDMAGFESITFICLVGAISDSPTGSVYLKAQQCVDSGSSPETWADLEGTKISYTSANDNKVVVLEISGPRERYVRPVLVRTSAAIDGVIAIQTGASTEPTTHDSSTVLSSELHLAPAEGTA